MDYTAIIAAGSGVLTVVLAKGVEWYAARCKARADREKQRASDQLAADKQRAELSIPINEQAVRILQGIIDSLREDMTKLTEAMRVQDERYLQVCEQKVTLQAQIEAVKQENVELKKRVTELETKLAHPGRK